MRTGDMVRHRPTGEKWVVACVRGEYLSWCGWPGGQARVEDCELVTPATDEEYWDLIRELAKMEGSDHRGRFARQVLEGATEEEERSKVHIIVSAPKLARDVGTCNGCNEQTDEHGINPHAKVREVQLQGMTIRLCANCARDLRWALDS